MSTTEIPSDFGASLPDELRHLLTTVPALGGALVVGGCIRDHLLGVPNKDHDVEVYGIGYEELAEALSRVGKVDLVGRPFGVVKVTTPSGVPHDFLLPRRETKVVKGHKGFDVVVDSGLSLREAAIQHERFLNCGFRVVVEGV